MTHLARTLLLLSFGALLAAVLAIATATSGASPPAQAAAPTAHAAALCSLPGTSTGNPANPLNSPGVTTDPLTNANLFVESPWFLGGDVANAIANLVGRGGLTHQTTGTPIPWATFEAQVNSMNLSPKVKFQVQQLEKIGRYPMAHQFSRFVSDKGQGKGTEGAIFNQVRRYLCRVNQTSPGAAGVITTYFVKHSSGGCKGNGGTQPLFKAEVRGLKRAVGNYPVLIFIEEDGVDTICFKSARFVKARTALLKYEIDQLSTLPHALEYVEGGTSDADSPKNVARVLNHADASKIRGFFLNDTHFNWAYKEIKFGNKVSRLTHGLHFVVDTRADGNGPLLNKNPVKNGVEQLCNPPGRALGPPPGATNGASYGMASPHLDGFVWATTPGESTAPTCKAQPGKHFAASGIFDPNIGVQLASHANARIGPSPRFPSHPY